MNILFDTAMRTSNQIVQAQAVNTNNLANASTSGFRAEIAYIASLESGGEAYSSPDLSAGTVRTTGRSLDVSINGEGWIAIVAPDGTEAYSRRGDLHVDALGQLSDGAGHNILGNSGPIALPPFSAVEIGSDGTVSIQPIGQSPNTLAVVDRIKLVRFEDSELTRGEDGLMRSTPGEVARPDASVRISSGSLEGSNVNTVAAMVKMIELARQFEGQIKLMQTAQENGAALSKIMSLN